MQDPTAALSELLTAAESLTPEAVSEDATLEDLATRLDLLIRIQSHLKDARDSIELTLVETVPEKEMNIGPLRIKKRSSKRGTWKVGGSDRMREDIKYTVAHKFATDIETGEVNVGRRNLISAAIEELWSGLPSFSAPLVGAQKKWGIDTGDYRDETWVDTISVGPALEEES